MIIHYQPANGSNFYVAKEMCTRCGYTRCVDKKERNREMGITPETCKHEDLTTTKIKYTDEVRYVCKSCFAVVDVKIP